MAQDKLARSFAPLHGHTAHDCPHSRLATPTTRLDPGRALLDAARAPIVLVDAAATISYANDAAAELVGAPVETLLGQPARTWLDRRGRGLLHVLLRRRLPGDVEFRLRMRHVDGSWRDVEGTASNHLDEPALGGVVIALRDLTRHRLTELALTESEATFRAMFQDNPQPMWIFDAETDEFLEVNEGAVEVYGYSRHEFLSMRVTDLECEHDTVNPPLELLQRGVMSGQLSRHRLRDGELIDVTLTLHPMRFQNRIAVLALVHDLTETKTLERELRRQALHDSLTGLANRVLFMDRVEEALATASRSNQLLAVIILDLDAFKGINDSLGHVAGDGLLSQVGHRLSRCLRPGDMLARLGGDEFAVLLPHLSKEADAARVAERLLVELSKPMRVANRELTVSASLGIALAAPSSSPEELLRNADVAMYVAKDSGRNRYELFVPSMHEQVVAAVALEADLRQAVEQDEIEVYYQPLVDLATGELAGFEALARWIHRERGFVSPAQFIPLAEQTGLIFPIGVRILELSCRQAREWQAAYPFARPLGLSVNLSARQLLHPEIVESVAEVLAKAGLPAASLTLEITESVLMEDLDIASRRLAELKRLGVHLALDDFGTGYSSLSYLQRFPIDILKIDKAFIDGMESPSSESALARSIIQLGEVLGLRITAEGVEHAEQARRLRELRCHTGQGYYFAKPLPARAASELLQRARTGTAWSLPAPRRSPEGAGTPTR